MRGWGGSAPARQGRNIELIIFKLDELLGDVFDPMPSGRPVLGSVLPDNRHAVGLDAGGGQHCTVDERQASTPKAGRNNDD